MDFLDGLQSGSENLLAIYGTYQSLDYAVNGAPQAAQVQQAQPAPAASDNSQLVYSIAGMVLAGLLLKLVLR